MLYRFPDFSKTYPVLSHNFTHTEGLVECLEECITSCYHASRCVQTLIEDIKRMPSLREYMLYYMIFFDLCYFDIHVYQCNGNAMFSCYLGISYVCLDIIRLFGYHLFVYLGNIWGVHTFIIPIFPSTPSRSTRLDFR